MGSWAQLTIRDHGRGIAKEDQERIFQRFERAIKASEVSGLGLGLYIARQITEMHQGTIEVASAPGGGAAFTVELPVAATARPMSQWNGPPGDEKKGRLGTDRDAPTRRPA